MFALPPSVLFVHQSYYVFAAYVICRIRPNLLAPAWKCGEAHGLQALAALTEGLLTTCHLFSFLNNFMEQISINILWVRFYCQPFLFILMISFVNYSAYMYSDLYRSYPLYFSPLP